MAACHRRHPAVRGGAEQMGCSGVRPGRGGVQLTGRLTSSGSLAAAQVQHRRQPALLVLCSPLASDLCVDAGVPLLSAVKGSVMGIWGATRGLSTDFAFTLLSRQGFWAKMQLGSGAILHGQAGGGC